MGTLRVNINQHLAMLHVCPGVSVVYGQLTHSAGPSPLSHSAQAALIFSPQLRPGARPGQSHTAVQSPVIIVVCNCCHMVKQFLL